MNAKIKLLAERADDFTDNKIQMQGEYHPDWHDIRDQKFAELILTEVTDILSTYRNKSIFLDGFEYNCQHPIIAIKERFEL